MTRDIGKPHKCLSLGPRLNYIFHVLLRHHWQSGSGGLAAAWLRGAVLRFPVLKMSIFFLREWGEKEKTASKASLNSGYLSIGEGSGGETGLLVGAPLSTAKMAASFSTRSLFPETQFTCAHTK